MKQQNDDKLKNLFREMNIAEPSLGFEERLMRQIEIETERKRKRNKLYNILWLFAGISAVTASVILVLQYIGISVSVPEFSKVEFRTLYHAFLSLNFKSSLIGFAGIILLMLMGDTLIRKRIEEKKSKK